MRLFLIKSAVFLSPLLLAFGLVEYRLGKMPSGYATKRQIVENRIGSAEILITGSSHSYYGINPLTLGRPALSLAYVSQGLYYDSRLLSKYLPEAKSAKLAIIPVSYFSFESMLDDWRAPFYRYYFDIPERNRLFAPESYTLIGAYGIPQTRDYILHGFESTPTERFDEGGGCADMRGTDVAAVTNARPILDRHHTTMKPSNIPENLKYLEGMIAELRQRGIRPVLITVPVYKSYAEGMDRAAFDRMQDAIKRISSDQGVEYFNYLRDERFQLEDFVDADHLNTKGAEKFSQILRDEVVTRKIGT